MPNPPDTSTARAEQPQHRSENQKSVPGARGDSPSSRQQASWKIGHARKVIADRIANRPAPSKEAAFDYVLTLAMVQNSAERGNYTIQVTPDDDHPTGRSHRRCAGLTEEFLLRECERTELTSVVEAVALREMMSKAIAWCAKQRVPIGRVGLGKRLNLTQAERRRLKVWNIHPIDHDEVEVKEHRAKLKSARNKRYREKHRTDEAREASRERRAEKKRLAAEVADRAYDREFRIERSCKKVEYEGREFSARHARRLKAAKGAGIERTAKPLPKHEQHLADIAERAKRQKPHPFPGKSPAAFKLRCKGPSRSKFFKDLKAERDKAEAIAPGEIVYEKLVPFGGSAAAPSGGNKNSKCPPQCLKKRDAVENSKCPRFLSGRRNPIRRVTGYREAFPALSPPRRFKLSMI